MVLSRLEIVFTAKAATGSIDELEAIEALSGVQR
jgi:hypothetical protein